MAIVSLILVFLLLIAFSFLAPTRLIINLDQLTVLDLTMASLATLSRLTIAYVLALFFAIPLALAVVRTPRIEEVLLPFIDILQSIPVLAFFPVIVLVFISLGLYEAAAVFVLFITMLWSIVFNVIGGLATVPVDINAAAFVFGAKGVKKLVYVTLPAVFPFVVTGSLLAWAAGWNISIVAEALHTYIPNGTAAQDLFGLGSLLVSASYQGKSTVFIGGLLIMIVIIATMNFFVWQKLLRLAERFKFD